MYAYVHIFEFCKANNNKRKYHYTGYTLWKFEIGIPIM